MPNEPSTQTPKKPDSVLGLRPALEASAQPPVQTIAASPVATPAAPVMPSSAKSRPATPVVPASRVRLDGVVAPKPVPEVAKTVLHADAPRAPAPVPRTPAPQLKVAVAVATKEPAPQPVVAVTAPVTVTAPAKKVAAPKKAPTLKAKVEAKETVSRVAKAPVKAVAKASVKSAAEPVARAQTLRVTVKPDNMSAAYTQAATHALDQARDAFSTTQVKVQALTKSFESSSEVMQKGVQSIQTHLIDAMQQQLDATFGFVRALSTAKTLSDAIDIQASHARKAFDVSTSHVKAVSSVATSTVSKAAEPVRKAFGKVFEGSHASH